jgi:hypothetical protein
MNDELTAKLFERYPLLYRKRSNTRMADGFACGDGWFAIIDRVSAALEAEIVRLQQTGMSARRLPAAFQVKEKFGALRFYLTRSNNETMNRAIEQAEQQSACTCESCGAPGLLRRSGWLCTLCDACEARFQRDEGGE